MTNDLTKTQNTALASAAQIRSALERAHAQMPVSGGDYMRFTKGDWTIGVDHKLVTDENVWVVAAHLIQAGYICWSEKNELLGKVLRPLTSGEVNPADLPQKDGRWDRLYAAQLRCVEGPHSGAQVIYETSSDGGQRWFSALTAATLQRMEEDDRFFLPVIVLGSETYQSKRYGRQVKPTFDIVDWASLDGEFSSGDVYDEDETEHEPEPEPEPARAAPTRARTRPAAASQPKETTPAEPATTPAASGRRRRIAG